MSLQRYAGLPGLYLSDSVELAAFAFPAVFAGASLVAPVREFDHVDSVVAALAGIDLYTGFLGTTNSVTSNQLQPYVLEIVALWQQALIAVQHVRAGSDHTVVEIVMLRRGEILLQATDPVATLRSWLPGGVSLR